MAKRSSFNLMPATRSLAPWVRPVRFAVYFLLIACLALLPALDLARPNAALGNQLFTESSLVELSQLALLAMSALAAVMLWRQPRHSPLGALLAFLLGAALVREMDYFLDLWLFDGAWQMLVAGLLASAMYYLWPARHRLRVSIRAMTERASFGLMFAGFAVVMGFSRLFGRGGFWQELMGSAYDRSVKNLAEESVELLGYAILTIGVIECVLGLGARPPRRR